MTLFYLSFADASHPKGDQFLGATIVDAEDALAAVAKSHRLKINPGGEVMIVELAPDADSLTLLRYLNELVPADEIRAQPHQRIPL